MTDERRDPARLSYGYAPILRDAYMAAASKTDKPLEQIEAPIHGLLDVVTLRRRGLEMAIAIGFPLPEATKIAVAISELGRNIILYAKRGSITLIAESEGQKGIRIIASDKGPGIPNLETVLSGGYTTSKGLGLGISGSKRLMDEFEIQTEVGKGTTITATKWLR